MQLCALDWILDMEKGSISAEPQQMLHSVHIVGKHSLQSGQIGGDAFHFPLSAFMHDLSQWLQLRIGHVLNGMQLHYCTLTIYWILIAGLDLVVIERYSIHFFRETYSGSLLRNVFISQFKAGHFTSASCNSIKFFN